MKISIIEAVASSLVPYPLWVDARKLVLRHEDTQTLSPCIKARQIRDIASPLRRTSRINTEQRNRIFRELRYLHKVWAPIIRLAIRLAIMWVDATQE